MQRRVDGVRRYCKVFALSSFCESRRLLCNCETAVTAADSKLETDFDALTTLAMERRVRSTEAVRGPHILPSTHVASDFAAYTWTLRLWSYIAQLSV